MPKLKPETIGEPKGGGILQPKTAQRTGCELQITPRGLSRTGAAWYVGVCPSKFDQLVKDGRMPKPIKIDGRVVWDIKDVNDAFENLKDEPPSNPWDDVD
jgi:predicted DNA-binding transcriptional regulator AlpA